MLKGSNSARDKNLSFRLSLSPASISTLKSHPWGVGVGSNSVVNGPRAEVHPETHSPFSQSIFRVLPKNLHEQLLLIIQRAVDVAPAVYLQVILLEARDRESSLPRLLASGVISESGFHRSPSTCLSPVQT